MPIEVSYNRTRAVAYAKTWALKRNPNYLNFDKIRTVTSQFIKV
ncbi:MAG TPA: hypothetical protein DEP60_06835 [Ruminococcaceae bacterium]|nr:hypothetical protein [Oscillospiraceae bacterium]